MRRLVARFGLPLLMKELREQAARRRTYVVRAVYASLVLLAGMMSYSEVTSRTGGTIYAVLGQGREVFDSLVLLQLFGVYLFAPAITASAVASEKDRNTLGTLLLTRLGPWAIVLEKYLSRLVVMFCFLIVSIPLMAVTYSLGGVNVSQLASAIWTLGVTILQVTAWALLCSTFFRTAISSLVGCYVGGVLVLVAPPMAVAFASLLLGEDRVNSLASKWDVLLLQMSQWLAATWQTSYWNDAWWGKWVQEWISIDALESYFVVGPIAALYPPLLIRNTFNSFFVTVVASLPNLLTTAILLLLARRHLVRRAFLDSANPVLRWFRRLDGLFQRWNQNRLTRGIVLMRHGDDLPRHQPVAWREVNKTALGAPRYLIRLLLLIEIPVVTISVLSVAAGTTEPLSVVNIVVWILAMLILIVKGACLITGERSRETLDVLLATPITSKEIIAEKLQGVRQLIAILLIPLLTVFCFRVAWELLVLRHFEWRMVVYAVTALSTMAIYFPLAALLSVSIGLRFHIQFRAVIAAVVLVVLWCVVPYFLGYALNLVFRIAFGRVWWIFRAVSPIHLSPAAIIATNEVDLWLHDTVWIWPTIVNWTVFGGALLWVRQYWLHQLDERLGRLE